MITTHRLSAGVHSAAKHGRLHSQALSVNNVPNNYVTVSGLQCEKVTPPPVPPCVTVCKLEKAQVWELDLVALCQPTVLQRSERRFPMPTGESREWDQWELFWGSKCIIYFFLFVFFTGCCRWHRLWSALRLKIARWEWVMRSTVRSFCDKHEKHDKNSQLKVAGEYKDSLSNCVFFFFGFLWQQHLSHSTRNRGGGEKKKKKKEEAWYKCAHDWACSTWNCPNMYHGFFLSFPPATLIFPS